MKSEDEDISGAITRLLKKKSSLVECAGLCSDIPDEEIEEIEGGMEDLSKSNRVVKASNNSNKNFRCVLFSSSESKSFGKAFLSKKRFFYKERLKCGLKNTDRRGWKRS